jgi:hypothetical protein
LDGPSSGPEPQADGRSDERGTLGPSVHPSAPNAFGLIRTTGTWDPYQRGRFFQSTQSAAMRNGILQPTDAVLVDAHELHPVRDRALMEGWVNQPSPGASLPRRALLIDSGVHNFIVDRLRTGTITWEDARTGSPERFHGFDRFLTRFEQVMAAYQDLAWGFFEIDLGDLAWRAEHRAKLAEQGLYPIPGWVIGDDTGGWDAFHELASAYDRVGIAGINAGFASGVQTLATLWEHAQQHPHTWIHLMGYTANQALHAYPCVGSCDSNNWTSAVQFRGYYARCDGHYWGTLPYGFRHRQGVEPTHPAGTRTAERMSIWAAYMQQRVWQVHSAGLDAALGGGAVE